MDEKEIIAKLTGKLGEDEKTITDFISSKIVENNKHIDELNERILELSKPKAEEKTFSDFMDELDNGDY